MEERRLIMKRYGKLALLAVLLLFLTGCGERELSFDSIKSGGIFVYPGTRWNMTPEEVMSALNLTEKQFARVSDPSAEEIKGVTDQLFLMEQAGVSGLAADVCFWFRSYGETGDLGLKAVTWLFARDADLEPVRRDITAALGEPARTDGEHALTYWDSEDSLDQYGTFAAEGEPAVSLILVDGPDTALPLASLPGVGPGAKALILGGNMGDVRQLAARGGAP